MASRLCNFCKEETYSDNIKFYVEGEEYLWDGFCKAGSRYYFMDLSAKNIVDNVELSVWALEQLSKEEQDDPMIIHKIDFVEDEVARAKRELLYRLEDGVYPTQKPEV